MSDMEHSDQPTPATPGSPSSAEATSPTETALGTPTDPTASTPDASAAATPAESAPADVAAPSAPSNVQERPKTKGVADIVFLVDVSGSMSPCIDALRRNIEAFIDSLSQGDANNAAPVRDWRGKVVGYRDIEAAKPKACPGSSTTPSCVMPAPSRRNSAPCRQTVAATSRNRFSTPSTRLPPWRRVPKGSQTEDPAKWRYRSDAARVVIVFTDASFKETMSLPEAKGGSLQDVANLVMANRIILSLFAPNFEGYDRLSQIDKSEWEVVEYEGLNPQEALQKFTSDPVNFRNTLKQLAASVSRSAATVAL